MVLALISVAMILMNILANKAIIELPIPGTNHFWLIQDAGILLSWVGFLSGDLLTKQFGAKHALRVNLTALFLSLFISLLLSLVAITPAADVVSPLWAIVLGAIAGVLTCLACGLKFKLGYDDSLDVVGVHGVGGFTGL